MNIVSSKASDIVTAASKILINISLNRGKIACPKAHKDLESLGIRFDFDGDQVGVDIDQQVVSCGAHAVSESTWALRGYTDISKFQS